MPLDESIAVLRLDRDAALVVRTEDTRWLRLEPRDAAAALELGYFAGNMHWKVRFDRNALEIAVKGAIDDYLQRLTPMLADQRTLQLGRVIHNTAYMLPYGFYLRALYYKNTGLGRSPTRSDIEGQMLDELTQDTTAH